MTREELYDVALASAKGKAVANYTAEDVNAVFVEGLKELAPNVNMFMKNRYDIYEILIKVADEIVPNKVVAALGSFAEIQSVGQGQKAVFRVKAGATRARKFLTQVGLSGVYDTFRLDTKTFELAAKAIGGGATVDFERMLDGVESMADVMNILVDGLSNAVFVEVQKALRAAINNMGAHNKVSKNTFDGADMFKLISVVRSYGNGAVIFAPPEFVGAMGADAIVPVGTYGTSFPANGVYSPDDIDAIHRTGYVNLFRGTPIVQIPQSVTDESNEYTWIDPQLAYILPTGGEKVVKVVLEGQTQVHDFQNRDNSMEVYAYKKMGCGILTYHNWAVYQNTGVAQTIDPSI